MNKKRCIFSYATDSHKKLLDYSLPTYKFYGEMFGYDTKIFSAKDVDLKGLSPHWAKIKLFQTVLEEYDVALWIDADAMFVRFEKDIEATMLKDDFQGLVLEQFPERWNPNTGVWLMRKCSESNEFLQTVLQGGEVAPYWADQAAVIKALGWSVGVYPLGIRLVNPSKYLKNTCWLPPEYNVLSPSPEARWQTSIKHFAGGPDHLSTARLKLMKNEYEKLNTWPNRMPWSNDAKADFIQK